MSLFWYPAIHYGPLFEGKFDKQLMLDSYVRYYLARLQCMFKYDGLPDTIPAKWLEQYLLCNGNALIAKGPDGELYAFTGGQGGDPDAYYIPTKYIVANPYLDLNSKTFTIDGDSVLIYNDTYSQGVLPLLQKYCMQLVENDITIYTSDILARATLNISCADDKTKASAELYLKRLRDGELGVLSEQAFIEGLNLSEFSAASASLTNLIELQQYLKASLFNELGLNSNYNMKREAINSNESQLNDDMLHPLIDNMLKERQEGLKRVNDMFGTDISVSFDSAWLENEKEEQAIMSQFESVSEASEGTTPDVSQVSSEVSGPEEAEEVPEVSPEEAEEVPEVSEEVPEVTEEETFTEEVQPIVEAIEDLTEAVEDITETIEGVNGDDLT